MTQVEGRTRYRAELVWTRRRAPWPVVVLGVALAVAIVHEIVVGQVYHFGTYYDDGHYALLGRALLDGHGYHDIAQSGNPIETTYPPGYPALLAAVMWVAGDANWFALRALSAVLFLVVVALSWLFLRDRRASVPVLAAVLGLLVVNPIAGGFSTMVMAEMPFLVVTMLLVVATTRWEYEPRMVTWWAAAAVLSLAAAIYLKSAGVAFVPALAAYLALRRRFGKAAFSLVLPLLLYLPVIIERASWHVSLVGGEYSAQLAGDQGFLAGLPARIAGNLQGYFTRVASDSIITSTFGLAEQSQPLVIRVILVAIRYVIAPLLVIGFVVAVRRQADVTTILVPVYLAETLAYPYLNERRIALVLPIALYWIVTGIAAVGQAIAALTRSARAPALTRPMAVAGVAVLFLAVFVPGVAQFGRDFRLSGGSNKIDPLQTPSLAVIRDIPSSADRVAAEYNYTVTLMTGHKTLRISHLCPPGWTTTNTANYLRRNTSAFATVGVYYYPDVLDPDSRCLMRGLDADPAHFVRLYRDPDEPSASYELIGPGTQNPDLVDAVAGRQATADEGTVSAPAEDFMVPNDEPGNYLSLSPDGSGSADVVVPFAAAATVQQMSISAAGGAHAPTSITVSLRRPDGTWLPVSATHGHNIGPVRSAARDPDGPPYLLVRPRAGVQATAVSVRFSGRGTFEVHDLHVLTTRR